MSEQFGNNQSVVVENRPGAGGGIGASYVLGAKPDGYTLHFANSGVLALPVMLKAYADFNPVEAFTPISLLAYTPYVILVPANSPTKNLREFIAMAQARPAPLTYSTAGNGSSGHLAAVLLALTAGIRLQHVPYKGSSPALTDVMGGQVQINFSTIVTAMPYAQSGRLQFLAVTSPQRAQVLPAVPTIAESGLPKYEALGWYVLMVRAGTPAPILARIHGGIVGALKDAAVRERLIKDGAEVVGNTPDEAARFLKAEIARWGAVVKSAGIKPE